MTDTLIDRPAQDAADAHTEQPSLQGKRVFVTGGTTGIGRAIAVLLASEGAKVFICGRDRQHLDDALARIREVGEGEGVALDLAETDNVGRFVEQAAQYLGGLDIAIINAAIAAEGLADTSEADLRYVIAADFTAYLVAAKLASERMIEQGAGDIIFTGSMSAHALGGGSTVYAGIKYGIQGFTEALRRELGDKGIRVGVVEPGKTGADMQEPDISPEEQREMIRKGEMLRAEDIAVGVRYMLTQPRRAVVQQLTITPIAQGGE
ncbi:SDR family oxidoreductase [Sphingomonas aracearum]|uniref:SDR family NAD(P)-dependent oxidoreductase n=1 Tax=Sphingomonas aracearum TaxID=2283317 RepID=A0A369VY37_9SPHN|nr:SDR family oxidoreductase [Sphingomonas aracearum]RDE06545.1 SDR family NAD(P)-dependent oxidoreductase [Sphingomonas aracearum]